MTLHRAFLVFLTRLRNLRQLTQVPVERHRPITRNTSALALNFAACSGCANADGPAGMLKATSAIKPPIRQRKKPTNARG